MIETTGSSLHSNPLIHSAVQAEMLSEQINSCLSCERERNISILCFKVWLESYVKEQFGLRWVEENAFNRGTCLTGTKKEGTATPDTWMTSNYFPCPSNCVLMQGWNQTWYEQLQAFNWKWLANRVWALVLRHSMNHWRARTHTGQSFCLTNTIAAAFQCAMTIVYSFSF